MPVTPRAQWDSVEQYIEYLRHLAAYKLFAGPLVTGKNVLEIGCGNGYGADELIRYTSSIVVMDMSEENIYYTHNKYKGNGIHTIIADGISLPFRSQAFDLVMSFQVIEHIDPKSVPRYLSEVKRVLVTGGTFIVSTPNSRLRLLPFQKPWNPEHRKEYKEREFETLLREVYKEVKVQGLCGSEEVLSLERNRVRQNPITGYLIRPVYQLLSQHFPAPVISGLKQAYGSLLNRKVGETAAQQAYSARFSLDDFRIDTACPKDCIDLYGTCLKV